MTDMRGESFMRIKKHHKNMKSILIKIYISSLVGCVFATVIMYRIGYQVFSIENIRRIPEFFKYIMR
jgi:hypothetical protein